MSPKNNAYDNIDIPRIMAYARLITQKYYNKNDPDYEDALGDSLLVASQAIKKYNPNDESNASVYTYVYKAIQRRMWGNLTRKNILPNTISRDVILDEYDIDICVEIIDMDKDLEIIQNLNHIQAIIKTMKNTSNNRYSKMIDVYDAVFVDGLSLVDAGVKLGISTERVRQLKEQFLLQLRRRFKNINKNKRSN